MNPETKLHKMFKTLAEQSVQTDDTAGGILRAVRELEIHTLERFTEAVQAAYAANGWNATRGRPTKDSTATPVPKLVRTYVWEVRQAFRFRVKVWEHATLYDLRKAVDEAREKGRTVRRPSLPALVGVQVSGGERLNGSIFHDLAVTYEHLGPRARKALEDRLEGVLRKAVAKLPAAVRGDVEASTAAAVH